MSRLFRRALSLLTVVTLAFGGTVVGLSPAQATTEVNVIPDRALRECIASAMHGAGTGASPGHPGWGTEADSISKDDIQALLNAWYVSGGNTGIYCSEVASLEGLDAIADLGHAEALRYLGLASGAVTNVAPLAGLTGLETLYLRGNQITDITALQGLVGLRSLNLSGNEIRDISALASLVGLQQLNLSDNDISGINPLGSLTSLEGLDLSNNPVNDITPLVSLSLLETLILVNDEITDSSPLSALATLTHLDLSINELTALPSLSGNVSFPSFFPEVAPGVGYGAGAPSIGPSLINAGVNHIRSVAAQVPNLCTATQWDWFQDANESLLTNFTDAKLQAFIASAPKCVAFHGPFQELADTAISGATALPSVVGFPGEPLKWRVAQGAATINGNQVTYPSAGTYVLQFESKSDGELTWYWADEEEEWMTAQWCDLQNGAYDEPLPYGTTYDPDVHWCTIDAEYSGTVTVNVTAGPSQSAIPSASDSDADKDIVVATTTGGAARLADGQNSYTITATVASKDGTPLTGFAANLTATAPADVSVGAWKDNGDGTYSALVTSAAPGNYEVRVALDGATIGTIPVNFIAATVSQTVRLLNESLHAEGLGFLPGEEVQVTVYSDPINLGRFTADGRGVVSADFTIPANFALGRHTVEFVGTTSGRVVVTFDVVAFDVATFDAVAASSGVKSSAGASTGGVVLASERAPMGIALAFTCIVAAVFVFAMTRTRPARAMR